VKREEIIGCGISSKNSSVRDKKDCIKKEQSLRPRKKGDFIDKEKADNKFFS
jgi:hypothetical protein